MAGREESDELVAADETIDEPRGSRWVWAAATFTVGYLVLVGWFISRMPECAYVVEPRASWACVLEQVSSLDLNEFSDFLAGLFAPIAFVWLATAVLVQAQELREQRRELRYTRREFKLTRKVAIAAKDETAAQAATAKETAAFIRKQTETMEQQHLARVAENADSAFNGMIKSLADRIRLWGTAVPLRLYAQQADGSVGEYSIGLAANDASTFTDERAIATMAPYLQRPAQELAAGTRMGVEKATQIELDDCLILVANIVNVRDLASPGAVAKASAIRLDSLKQSLTVLAGHVELAEVSRQGTYGSPVLKFVETHS